MAPWCCDDAATFLYNVAGWLLESIAVRYPFEVTILLL